AGSKRISLPVFWLRRARRLLPAAFLVLGVTLIGTLFFVPDVLWRQFLTEIGASGLYLENWLLAANAVDSFGTDHGASPVQHYWSLSVEEQFYLVWPVIIILLAMLVRQTHLISQRAIFAGGIGMIFVASFIYSVMVAGEESGYFSTFTHIWEFAA